MRIPRSDAESRTDRLVVSKALGPVRASNGHTPRASRPLASRRSGASSYSSRAAGHCLSTGRCMDNALTPAGTRPSRRHPMSQHARFHRAPSAVPGRARAAPCQMGSASPGTKTSSRPSPVLCSRTPSSCRTRMWSETVPFSTMLCAIRSAWLRKYAFASGRVSSSRASHRETVHCRQPSRSAIATWVSPPDATAGAPRGPRARRAGGTPASGAPVAQTGRPHRARAAPSTRSPSPPVAP
jgi:hypothetical protein